MKSAVFFLGLILIASATALDDYAGKLLILGNRIFVITEPEAAQGLFHS